MTDDEPDDDIDDQPPLGDAWETDWPDEMDSQERIEAVAETIRQPRSSEWIAKRAGVSPKTARKYLERFVERNEFVTTRSEESGATLYGPYPRQKLINNIYEIAKERSEEELTELRTENAKDIKEWRDEFGVPTPNLLRLTIDESISTEERRRRQKIAHLWEKRQYVNWKTKVAMAFRDHFDEFGIPAAKLENEEGAHD